mgnify:CR=1 FL=1
MSITNKQSNILNQNIGIAGCGEMGYPMLKVLLQNDINATGHDVKAIENFKDFGNKYIPSKSEFFLKNDVILSIVRDTIETENLLINNNELLSKKNATILICSTLPTTYISELKKKLPQNFTVIDTPMSGSTIKAQEGTLTFMVGGNENEVQNVMPLLNILGDNILHIGEFGKGMSVKLLNNFIAVSSVLATRNVLSQINDFGLTKKQLLDVVKCSTGDNWFAQNYDTLNWSKENFKKTNTKMIKDLDLLAYEVIEPKMIPSKQMAFLVKYFKNNTIKHLVVKDKQVNTEFLSKKLLDWRENYFWEIDGIVVYHDKLHPRTTGNPKHAFAFKMVLSDQIVEARVHDVIWSPSKDGYLKPKIQIEPVKIGGAKITFATAHNAAFVYGKNYDNPEEGYIGPGAIIQIIRSGDVIPKVHKVVAPALKPKEPPSNYKFTWNKSGIDFILDNKDDDETVKMKRISAFFEKIEVGGLGRGNVKRIMDAGFDTVDKIISMTYDDLLTVEGFKEKMAEKIETNISNAIEKVSIYTLMNGSNIFGRGMGEKRIKLILDTYPNILFSKKTDKEKIKMVADLPGFQEKTAMAFVPHIKKFIKFADKIGILNRFKNIKINDGDKSHPLYKKNIVFTGVRDKVFQKQLEDIGSNISSSVGSKTDFVIVKDLDDFTSKAEKAQELNIPIHTLDDFKQKYFN